MDQTSIPVHLIAAASLLAAAATVAPGQVDPPDQNAGESLRQIDLNAPDAALASRLMLPEGSFIAGQEGTLVRTPSGDRLFVYLPDEGHKPVALLMVPCLELERLEKAAADSQAEAPLFLLTGQILAYHRRNYLLPSAWTQLRTPAPAEGEVEPAAENPDPARTVPADDDEIANLIRELELSRDDPQALLRRGNRLWLAPRQANETDEENPEGPPDGSLISRRTGRFVRQGVVWVITFDNDSESETKKDVPLIVLPCLNHEKLERLAGRRADEFQVEISGRVFQYKGRHYLLPSVFQVVPEGDVRPIG
jgi:hypothetical protein